MQMEQIQSSLFTFTFDLNYPFLFFLIEIKNKEKYNPFITCFKKF